MTRKDIRDIFRINLRYYRIKNKMTQEDLAVKSDLTDKYISDLERGIFSPSLEKLDMLAEALNIDTYLLLKDDNAHENIPNRLDKVTGSRKSKRKY
ncbi:MAG TPA: helix-turn-helix transcriptional regulator [Candidatus Onthousia excrementipullorum]|uniref:Helix-turn-helix transcriptional regulator n=1 Tax=Candidatus Onthousia excrementipullorum TaxID=2840884 RepID=A0A9D1J2U5_9FIRM|nr:helix-turn-helix transcriptional regulator [Candidatus Onthousia excrementipullorum]